MNAVIQAKLLELAKRLGKDMEESIAAPELGHQATRQKTLHAHHGSKNHNISEPKTRRKMAARSRRINRKCTR